MLSTPSSTRGMVSAPHHLAAGAGLAVLRDGGNAIEAVIAAAAAATVVYPHMTGLGGDGFWLIWEPGRNAVSIDSCGVAGAKVSIEAYRQRGLNAVPLRGALAANTVAGTVSGWQAALEVSNRWGGSLPLARLFEEAIHHARHGYAVADGLAKNAAQVAGDIAASPGMDLFLPAGKAPKAGQILRNPALAATYERLAASGLDDFYRGGVGRALAADLQAAGSLLSGEDLARHRSVRRRPLSLQLKDGTAYNLPPPTQGLSSLMILGMLDRLGVKQAETAAHVHAIVEATKQAFLVRNAQVTDPAYMSVHATTYLVDHMLDRLAANISPKKALAWPKAGDGGDTVWIGAIDGEGRAVSFIQSLYSPFGSGLVLPETGIVWQNRGATFALDEAVLNHLKPGRKPFHTLNPALARLKDGRVMVYGSMGGEGQPQTQAAIYSRYVQFGQSLQQAVTAPRWVLGKAASGGGNATDLKIESRFDPAVIQGLQTLGHTVSVVPDFDPIMGHAGALVHHESGLIEGASDPRSDGSVAAY